MAQTDFINTCQMLKRKVTFTNKSEPGKEASQCRSLSSPPQPSLPINSTGSSFQSTSLRVAKCPTPSLIRSNRFLFSSFDYFESYKKIPTLTHQKKQLSLFLELSFFKYSSCFFLALLLLSSFHLICNYLSLVPLLPLSQKGVTLHKYPLLVISRVNLDILSHLYNNIDLKILFLTGNHPGLICCKFILYFELP